jgi:hypothetical protein
MLRVGSDRRIFVPTHDEHSTVHAFEVVVNVTGKIEPREPMPGTEKTLVEET